MRSGVSRPALTRARQRLEQELGGTLVYRNGKDSRLTALGRDIRSEFAAIAEREQRVRALSLNQTRGRGETLTLGVVNTIAPALITGFFTHALRHFGTKLGTRRISDFTPEQESRQGSKQIALGPHDADLVVCNLDPLGQQPEVVAAIAAPSARIRFRAVLANWRSICGETA